LRDRPSRRLPGLAGVARSAEGKTLSDAWPAPYCDPQHVSDPFRSPKSKFHGTERFFGGSGAERATPYTRPVRPHTHEEAALPHGWGRAAAKTGTRHQVVFCTCIKNSALLLESFILSRSNSMACWVSSACSTRRNFQTMLSSSPDMRISSLRVLDASTSTAGKIRLSARDRLSLSSMFPVPLNSSKITSSAREPVSTRAVARMVSEPPPSMLRAAPKKRFGGYRAVESTPPDMMRPLAGAARL